VWRLCRTGFAIPIGPEACTRESCARAPFPLDTLEYAMSRDPHGLHRSAPARGAHLSPPATASRSVDGRTVVGLADDELRQLGLTPGSTLTVDRARRPTNGDLVWVELVRYGSTQRLIRRYALAAGWITLSLLDESVPAIMRRQGELLILGVVDIDTDTPPGSAAS
jgi:hypothetical protein